MFTMTVCLISIWIITTVNYTMLQLTISSKHNISTFISDDLFAHVYSNLFIVTCTYDVSKLCTLRCIIILCKCVRFIVKRCSFIL